MITATIETAPLNNLLRKLEAYQLVSGKSIEDVLEKKGRDLGIRLYKGFTEVKWGGPGKHPGLARAELAARTAAGRGTRVRPSLLVQYRGRRQELNTAVRSIGQRLSQRNFRGTLDQWSGLREQRAAVRKERASLWQMTVGREISARQSGIGALAAAFLWYRSRTSQARGTYYVRNHTGSPIGYVDRGTGFFRIVSDVKATDVIDRRFGISTKAITGAIEDIEVYLARDHTTNFNKLFGGAA